MSIIHRLDHVIVAVADRSQWLPVIERVLGLTPGRMLEGSGAGAAAFSNAEFAIGDGFLGVVEPAGPASQLHRFLERSGDGFYAISIDVGDVGAATAALDAAAVDHRGQPGALVWAGPRRTHGVLYQVIGGMLLGAGANPNYLGLARFTVVVEDLAEATATYRAAFGLPDGPAVVDEPRSTRGRRLPIPGAGLDQHVLLVQPTGAGPVARHLLERGEGIWSFGIAVSDLAAEMERLEALDVAVDVDPGVPGRATIDPGALRGLRVELLQAG
ncbi:MAG TPA: VOC family protein [Acidimicrobiales bacterium]|jgi:hypothetical protein